MSGGDSQEQASRIAAVLVVDDDAPVVRAISTTLRRVAPIMQASSVAEAKPILDAGSWLAFIFDGELADGSCFELLDYARARHPDVPALVLTGRANAEFRERVQATGAAYMNKPFELPDLRAFVLAAKNATAK